MSQNVMVAEKVNNRLQKLTPIPTARNIKMYELYASGITTSEIAEQYGTTPQNVSIHLRRVGDYLGENWRTIQQNKLKLKNDKVIASFDDLIEQRNPQVTINHLNKLVYPNQIEIKKTEFHVHAVMDSVFNDKDVVETESQVIDTVINDNSDDDTDRIQVSDKQGANSDTASVNGVLSNE